MAIDTNDEILQDFLVEAGELLESLNEQLILLEQEPDNRDLLNAVFRGFHTIKGGAGFLNLNALVAVCHHAEDVFNLLRNGERRVDAALMDTILRVLDVLNVMFGALQAGQEPDPAPPALIESLQRLAVPGGPEPAAPLPAPAVVETPPPESAAPDPVPVATAAMPQAGADADLVGAGDDITEAEFEALLDALQGSGPPPASPSEPSGSSEPPTTDASDPAPVAAPAATGEADLITDDEFEALLDQLRGRGAPDPAPAPAPAPRAPPVAAAPAPESESAAPPVAASRAPAAPPAQVETSVRVDTQRLDEIMNLVGELVLVRNRMSMLRSQTDDDELAKAIGALALVTADLQTAVMKTRMQPIKKVFGRFPRVVRDLARTLGKEIELEIYGEDTDLDKNLVEALADPLVHLVRNAVDHGIETPEVRAAAGKPVKGTVILAAAQEGDHIALTIDDDGRGMDPRILRAKAVEKGLLDPAQAERLSDQEAFNLIFMAGFSTKEEISDVSGRGVGMDVVKNRIAQLNGTVEIDSQLGRGTRLQIKLPLTLAILPALMVILDGRRFAIPLASVSEILDLDLTASRFVDDQEVIVVRQHALPLYYVARWLRPERLSQPKTDGHVVVVQVAQRKVGLVVDDLVGQEEVVIKPLGMGLRGVPGLAGATITGDGGIALILDVPALLRVLGRPGYGGRASRAARPTPMRAEV